MRYIKYRAFTLAEVMVLLLTLSILMAAFAPVFTRRATTVAADEVWTFVAGDDNANAYYDALNKSYTAQAFIGVTPASQFDVPLASSDSAGNLLYSKLVISASGRLSVGKLQNQMQFRYGNSAAGTMVGALFAGNDNILVGGNYNDIKSTARANTAYGVGSLSEIESGVGNTAVGYYALNTVESGSYNTAIGVNAGKGIKSGSRNTIIGHEAAGSASSNPIENTLIGYRAGYKISGRGNTLVGNHSASIDSVSGNYNTAFGNSALKNLSGGSFNTAIGANSMTNLKGGSYNTAFGSGSCALLQGGSNKTCIGADSGAPGAKDPAVGLFTGSEERVFIGAMPKVILSGSDRPGAVLEVHNVDGTRNNSKPIAGVGNASVMINGNLIVRGQSFFETPIVRPRNMDATSNTQVPKGLVAYRLTTVLDKGGNKLWGFSGYDGAQRTSASYQPCNGCRRHEFNDIRTNCICTAVSDKCPDSRYDNTGTFGVSTSYDWTTNSTGNLYNDAGCDANNPVGNQYRDGSAGCTFTIHGDSGDKSGGAGTREVDYSLAHSKSGSSCCPDLKSDIRLKNVGTQFTAGLDELRKLKIYNYTYKKDPNKLPQVGVIAQDLKLVFPTAVSKDKDGYYKIRWDEMFYAAINSVKALNTKIEKLVSKVTADKERVSALKRDNAELNLKLDALAQELDQIETKRK